MKILIVYYSRTGVTKKLAEKISEILGADLEMIKDSSDRSGVMGYLKSGREAATKKIVTISPLVSQLKDYELVIVGTPVWAFTISSPVRTFFEQHKEELKNWALFCTQGGSGEQNTLKGAENIVNHPAKAFLNLLTKEVLREDISFKLANFKNKLLG